MAIQASGVQQGLTRTSDLRAELQRPGQMLRRALLLAILGDIEGGAQALSGLDFTQKVIRRFGLPEPSRQVGKRDSRNRQRWIDVAFEEWKVVVEIDGAQHSQPLEQWDDMERDNDLRAEGYEVLRFPAWLVRQNPGFIARRIREAGPGHRAGGLTGVVGRSRRYHDAAPRKDRTSARTASPSARTEQ